MKILKTTLVILGWFVLLWGMCFVGHVFNAMGGEWTIFPMFLSGVVLLLGSFLLSCYLIFDRIWKII